MATESDLRSLLRDDEPGSAPGPIDVDAVLRRARRRRRPRAVALAVGGALAASAVLGPVVALGTAGGGGVAITADAGMESLGGGDAPAAPATEDEARALAGLACGAEPAVAAAAAEGLALETRDVDLDSGALVLALRNDGSERLRGVLASPSAATLARDGLVVAVGDAGPPTPRPFDLAPGAEIALALPIALASCGDELAAGPADLVVVAQVRLDGSPDATTVTSEARVIEVG